MAEQSNGYEDVTLPPGMEWAPGAGDDACRTKAKPFVYYASSRLAWAAFRSGINAELQTFEAADTLPGAPLVK